MWELTLHLTSNQSVNIVRFTLTTLQLALQLLKRVKPVQMYYL